MLRRETETLHAFFIVGHATGNAKKRVQEALARQTDLENGTSPTHAGSEATAKEGPPSKRESTAGKSITGKTR